MKGPFRMAFLLLLVLSSIPLFFAADAVAADPGLFTDPTGTAESLDRPPVDAAILRFSAAYDPFTAGLLAPGFKPCLDLLDQSSYSLKLSLPVTWGPDFFGWGEDGGGFLSAGLMASVQLRPLQGRYGSWVLNTGLFLIRRDQNSWDQSTYSDDSETRGGIGAVNISIIY